MVFESGHKIGSYRIVRLLGQGGMGAVYEVEHKQRNIRVLPGCGDATT